jgi:hypothetical protein
MYLGLVGVYLALIVNWQSHVSVRLYSPDADTLVFSFLINAIPLALYLYVTRLQVSLPRVVRHLCVLLCMFGLTFGLAVLLWNSDPIGSIVRGRGDVRLVATLHFGDRRIDAYQIENFYFGPTVSLRLRYSIIPGVLLSKEFAAIEWTGDKPIDRLAILAPDQLCVTFTTAWSNVNHQRTVLVPIIPFASQDVTEVGFDDGPLPPDCSSAERADN